ncbi:MAG: nucleotide exchange factor GrpE [Deltaproteobacteria bacterium]|nr:nucleotide exchange factor GrpE [Deltaproteobacteria bacterium]
MTDVKPATFKIDADAVFKEALESQAKREQAAPEPGAGEVPLEVAPAATGEIIVAVEPPAAEAGAPELAAAAPEPAAEPAPAAPVAPAPPPKKSPQDLIIEALIKGKQEATEALKQTQKEAKDLLDARVRLQAEFENYKKRVGKEKQEAQLQVTKNLMREILPVMDNLERALSHVNREESSADMKNLLVGIDMVAKQLVDAVKKIGVTGFTAKGQPFDPGRHEAVSQVPAEGEASPGTVVEEHQRGYMLGEVLLRPALVVVAGPKA